MSVFAISWAYNQQTGKAGAKALLVALANFADGSGRCWPAQETLAEMLETDTRSIRRYADFLEQNGFIKREVRRDEKGHRASDIYVLLAPEKELKPGKNQPDKLTAREASQPDNLSTRSESLPDNLSIPTGQSVQSLPDNLSGIYNKAEPSIRTVIEPSDVGAIATNAPGSASVSKPKKTVSKKPVATEISLDEWLTLLQASDAYKTLDVKQCWQKMAMWCAVRNKAPTKRRFINWLNNEDAPISTGVTQNGTNYRKPTPQQTRADIIANRWYNQPGYIDAATGEVVGNNY